MLVLTPASQIFEVTIIKNSKVRIGVAPDFVVYIGKECCHHSVAINVSIFYGQPYRLTLSHKSMLRLVCELKQILCAINFRDGDKVFWRDDGSQIGEIATNVGTASFIYSCSDRLSQENLSTLNIQFQRFFKEN